MSTTPNKKSKTSQEAELDAVREHLLTCQNVPKDCRALRVALDALDQERKRLERDAKLQRKFCQAQQQEKESFLKTSNNNKKTKNGEALLENRNQGITTNTSLDDAELEMEWQDVAPDQSSLEQTMVEVPSMDGSVLGKALARESIASMASSKTTVASPLGAIALALHAALCSDALGFKCTGVPTEETSSSFAAPIRELPKNQLVPPEWEKHASDTVQSPHVKLRYRKDGVGAIVLNVTLDDCDEKTVKVELAPTSSKEPRELTFRLDDHVNVESLSKALQGGRVVPTLHYKALPVLLTNVVNTFDLGPVQEEETEATTLPYVDTTVVPPSSSTTTTSSLRVPSTSSQQQYNPHETPRISMFQPNLRRPGDFDRDLLPTGGVDPTGMLMGPNHPAFGGSVLPPSNTSSGYGMRPRHDPFGPPGGPQDPNDPSLRQGRARGRGAGPTPPGGLGDPNHDHARPPNNLSNNMYM